jgi:hypothetical protein
MTVIPSTHTIEALDFSHVPPCEHSGHLLEPECHAGPAYVYVSAVCEGCGDQTYMYLCKKWWEFINQGSIWDVLVCPDCGHQTPMCQTYTFLAYVKK